MPFFINQYKEETANVVQRAKAEIDAALQGAVIRAGVKALGIQMNNKIEANKDADVDKLQF